VSWGIALFEYLAQVPANRIGHQKEPLRLNDLWAALCLCGAVYRVFKGSWGGREG